MKKISRLSAENFQKMIKLIVEIIVSSRHEISDRELLEVIAKKAPNYTFGLIDSAINIARKKTENDNIKKTQFQKEILDPLTELSKSERYNTGDEKLFLICSVDELTDALPEDLNISVPRLHAGIYHVVETILTDLVSAGLDYTHLNMDINDVAEDIVDYEIDDRHYLVLKGIINVQLSMHHDEFKLKAEEQLEGERLLEAERQTERERHEREQEEARIKTLQDKNNLVKEIISRPKVQAITALKQTFFAFRIDNENEIGLLGGSIFCIASGLTKGKSVFVYFEDNFYWVTKHKGGRIEQELDEDVSLVEEVKFPYRFRSISIFGDTDKAKGVVKEVSIVPEKYWKFHDHLLKRIGNGWWVVTVVPQKENFVDLYKVSMNNVFKIGTCRIATQQEIDNRLNCQDDLDWDDIDPLEVLEMV